MEIKWLKIVNQSNGETEIDIDGIIGWDEDSWPAIKKKLVDIAKSGQKKLIVNIFSLGGFISDGIMIHDALKIARAKIETRIFSMSASAATLIAQSGDKRKMSSNALYLIHRASNIAWGNVNDLRAQVDLLEKVDERIKDIYVKKGSDPEVIESLMSEDNGNGKWIDADEALEAGLIDEIFEPTRAVAMVTDEYFEKYKLPRIPDNLLNKIKMEKETVVQEQPEVQKDKKGLFKSTIDLLNSLIKGEDEGDEPGAGDAGTQAEEPPAVPGPEIETEEKVEDQVPQETEEMKQLKTLVNSLSSEVASLRADLGEAQTKLAQAGAKSTIIKGPTGREGDTIDDIKVNPEVKDSLDALNRAYGGGYLENPSKKKPQQKEDGPEK